MVKLNQEIVTSFSEVDPKDLRYFFGGMHYDNTRAANTMPVKDTIVTDSNGNLTLGRGDLEGLVVSVGAPSKARFILGNASGSKHGQEFWYMQLAHSDEFENYSISGFTSAEQAKDLERKVFLGLVGLGSVSLSTEIAQQTDGSYQVRVALESKSPFQLRGAVDYLQANGVDARLEAIAKTLNEGLRMTTVNNDYPINGQHSVQKKNERVHLPPPGDLDEYLHFIKHRSRAGFVNSDSARGKLRSNGGSAEVYLRQGRIADQIAEAMNSAASPEDVSYKRARELHVTLSRDIRENGNELFGEPKLSRYFVGAVSVALNKGVLAILVPEQIREKPNEVTYYKVVPRA